MNKVTVSTHKFKIEGRPGAWLVQIKGGGHGAMYQYPEEFSKVLLTFLNTT
jgi:pimeloyl-ACP methyl ester carboxylesterase